MKRISFLIMFSCAAAHLQAQNLIANPGFETYTACPSNPSQVANAVPWTPMQNHIGTPDYFHVCATNNQVQVPANIYGYQAAASGSAYAGLSLFIYGPAPDYKEYIVTQLISPLSAGHDYILSLKYSLADECKYATDDFGAYFSVTPPLGANNWNPAPYMPQVTSPVVLNDKNGWSTITMNYTAAGGEQYLLLGNFLNDASTSLTPVPNPGWFDGAYLYIDDISLTEVSQGGTLSVTGDTVICPGDTVRLHAHGSPWYQWATSTDPGTVFSGDSVVYVSPPVTTTYLVYGANDTVSFTVKVLNVPVAYLGNDTVLCEGQSMTLHIAAANAAYLWQDSSTAATFIVDRPGTYWVSITAGKCYSSDTIHVRYSPYPDIDLGPDKYLCDGKYLILDAACPNGSYTWNDGSTKATLTVTQPGIYYVDVGVDGCHIQDSIRIIRQTTDCSCIVFIPDAFSPNGDQFNNTLKPINAQDNVRLHEFAIYDRWGELVFRSFQISTAWDGTFRNLPASVGTYFYFLRYTCLKDQKDYFIKGDVILVR